MSKKVENTDQNMLFALVTPSGVAVNDMVDWDLYYSGCKWVKWGPDNKMPAILWDNYLKNSLLASIINHMVDYVGGVEPVGDVPGSDADDSFEDIVHKCVFDYILFGGFAVECIRNAKGDIVRVNYQNVANVRINEDLTVAYLSNKWNTYSTAKYTELPLYDKNEVQDHFIFYYRGPITRGVNPIPRYVSALKSIEILNNTRNFHKRNLENGFSASVIVNINNDKIKSREMKEIKEQLEDGYTGSTNAGRFLLMNGGDKDHAATIERLSADNFGDLYKSLDESSKEDIYVSFGINPMLLGKNENTGFNDTEFENAYALFYSTTIKPIQNTIATQFGKLGIEFVWKPFIINWKKEG